MLAVAFYALVRLNKKKWQMLGLHVKRTYLSQCQNIEMGWPKNIPESPEPSLLARPNEKSPSFLYLMISQRPSGSIIIFKG